MVPGLFVALVSSFALGCGGSTSPVAPQGQSGGLIQNGSFEHNGEPTLAGWAFGNSELASSARLAPSGEGAWSLRLDADWAPTLGFAYAKVTDVRPGDRLRLSAFVRAVQPNGDGGGIIAIVFGDSPMSPDQVCGAGTSESTWTPVSVEALVPEGKTVWVLLSSLHTEVTQRSGLFDGVQLVRLEP